MNRDRPISKLKETIHLIQTEGVTSAQSLSIKMNASSYEVRELIKILAQQGILANEICPITLGCNTCEKSMCKSSRI
ncbi:MAG: hypothetical protein ACXAB7_14145 [Candidatus Kariarchaeaceae archaeon]|jgi:hypothetical protein